MSVGLVDPNLLRKYIVDAESILSLRETCRFFAFCVFPNECLHNQACNIANRKLKHVIGCTKAPCTVDTYLKWTFYGLQPTDDMHKIHKVLSWSPEITRTIVSLWAKKNWGLHVTRVRRDDVGNIGFLCMAPVTYRIDGGFRTPYSEYVYFTMTSTEITPIAIFTESVHSILHRIYSSYSLYEMICDWQEHVLKP